MLSSILIQGTGASLAVGPVVLCTVVSLALGVAVALIHMYQNTYSRNFIITLALLPAIVQAVIMIVNGNLGTGVAVMGAFSLGGFPPRAGKSRGNGGGVPVLLNNLRRRRGSQCGVMVGPVRLQKKNNRDQVKADASNKP